MLKCFYLFFVCKHIDIKIWWYINIGPTHRAQNKPSYAGGCREDLGTLLSVSLLVYGALMWIMFMWLMLIREDGILIQHFQRCLNAILSSYWMDGFDFSFLLEAVASNHTAWNQASPERVSRWSGYHRRSPLEPENALTLRPNSQNPDGWRGLTQKRKVKWEDASQPEIRYNRILKTRSGRQFVITV